MAEKNLYDHLNLSDIPVFQRLQFIIKITAAPMVIIIGASTKNLAYSFKNIITEKLQIDKLFDFNQEKKTAIEIRKFLLQNKCKTILFILNYDDEDDFSSRILQTLNINRDLIYLNKHKVIIIGNRKYYNELISRYYDLFSVAAFAYLFYDFSLPDLKTPYPKISQIVKHYKKLEQTSTESLIVKLSYKLQYSIWSRRNGNFQEAINNLEEGINSLNDKKNQNLSLKELLADYYRNLGKTYLECGNYKEAIEQLDKGIQQFHKIINKTRDKDINQQFQKKIITSIIRQAYAYIKTGDLENASKKIDLANTLNSEYENSVTKTKERDFKYIKARSLLYKIQLYYSLATGKKDLALNFIKEKEDLINYHEPNTSAIGYVYEDYATFYNFYGDYEKAKEFYTKAIKLFYQKGLIRQANITYNALANLYLSSINVAKTFSIQKKIHSIILRKDFKDIQVNSFLNLAKIFFYLGHFKSSNDNLHSAFRLAHDIQYFKGKSETSFLFSILHTYLENTDLAKKYLEELKTLNSKTHSSETKLYALIAESYISYKDENFSHSAKTGYQAIELAKKINNFPALTRACFLSGWSLMDLNQSHKAIECFELGYQKAKEHNFLEGILLNGVYFFDYKINKHTNKQNSLKYLNSLMEIAEQKRFTIFAPLIYKRLAELSDNESDKKFYIKKANNLNALLKKNYP